MKRESFNFDSVTFSGSRESVLISTPFKNLRMLFKQRHAKRIGLKINAEQGITSSRKQAKKGQCSQHKASHFIYDTL